MFGRPWLAKSDEEGGGGGWVIGLIYFSMLHLFQIVLPFSKTRSKRFAKNEMGWMSLVVNILSGHVSSSLLSLKCEITPILHIFLFTFFLT